MPAAATADRPAVVVLVPAATYRDMFATDDLAPLRAAASVTSAPDLASAGSPLDACQVLVTGWGSPRLDGAVLDRLPALRLVAHSAGSVKGVVTDAVYARGVRVTSAAAANAVPVAEFTVAMMVMMLKQVPWLAQHVRSGGWGTADRPVRELRDLSVGIVSASRIGREVVRLLRVYPRLTVKVYDPYLAPADAAALGVEVGPLDDVCRCDVVTVHAPSLPETRHLLDAGRLRLLPDHAVLINTARGGLVDEAALVAEVRRRPLYVCLDVTDPEPPAAGSPLRAEPNILLTPHVAGAMRQARRDMGRLAVDEACRFLRGDPLRHEVTHAMLATTA